MADVGFYNPFPYTFTISLPGGQTITLGEFSEKGKNHYVPEEMVDRYGSEYFDRKTTENGGELIREDESKKTAVEKSFKGYTDYARGLAESPVEPPEEPEALEPIPEPKVVPEMLQDPLGDTVDVSSWGTAELKAFLEGRGVEFHHRTGDKKLRTLVERELNSGEAVS
jgi:hypothetical protein